jgi:glycolate oxidase iron-sulfur subunit
MEGIRAQLATGIAGTGRWRRTRRFVLRSVVARPRVLAAVMAPVRWFAGSRLRRLVRAAGLLRIVPRAGLLEAQLPRRPGPPFRPGEALPPPAAGARGDALLFCGCIMGELFGEVHRATARVLAKNGVHVAAPGAQVCCGALHAHDGDLEFARRLARRNIEAFEGAGEGPIVVNAAGCAAAMKEYGELLAADPRWSQRARRFGARVRDFSEYLATLGPDMDARFEGRVTYQDPCHLAHAQRIREAPRALLGMVQGCELVETVGADRCCGAAGLYGLVQPAMSAELRRLKAAEFRAARPDVVVTANPGCQLQYEAAVREAGIEARVMHIAELLDEACRAAERAGLRGRDAGE